ncbi:MAG: hypothetical protein FWE87_02405 [Coriobacteriia bacterium]|nr:hypothetical protein [Coriobacteriia bacterium]
MNLQLPDEVCILDISYRVAVVDSIKEDDLVIGHVDHQSQTIRIKSDLSQAKAEQTLLHEVLHGVFNELGEYRIDEDERLVQSLAATLHQVGYRLPLREGV